MKPHLDNETLQEIGRIIVAFTTLEYNIRYCLARLIDEKNLIFGAKVVTEITSINRCAQLLKALSARKNVNHTALRDLFKRMEKDRQKRNKMAHDTYLYEVSTEGAKLVLLNYFVLYKGKFELVTNPKAKRKDPKTKFSLKELKELAETVEGYSDELRNIFADLLK